MIKSIYSYVRIGVVLFAGCCWNQVMGQLTPYYVTTFFCTPNQDPNNVCQVSLSGTHGYIAAFGEGYCAQYRGRNPPLDVYASVSWTCTGSYMAAVSAYPTPQAGDTYHYAVSSGTHFSLCSPDGYSQQACDVLYNYITAPCGLPSC
jgi:hypothetical protein